MLNNTMDFSPLVTFLTLSASEACAKRPSTLHCQLFTLRFGTYSNFTEKKPAITLDFSDTANYFSCVGMQAFRPDLATPSV